MSQLAVDAYNVTQHSPESAVWSTFRKVNDVGSDLLSEDDIHWIQSLYEPNSILPLLESGDADIHTFKALRVLVRASAHVHGQELSRWMMAVMYLLVKCMCRLMPWAR